MSEDYNVIQTENGVIVNPKSDKQRKKEYRKERKNKRNGRVARFRRLKNFIFFITGFISAFVLLFGGIAMVVKFIPLNTFVPDEVVKSDTLGSKSVYDAVLYITDYGVEDVPFLYDLLGGALSSTGIVNLNEEKFKELKFNETFGSGVLECLRISKDLFGDLGNLELFSTVPVPERDDPENPATTDYNPKLFYVIESGSIEGGDAVYKRAYNDDGTRVEGTELKPLYYPAINELNLLDLLNVFGERFQLLKVKDIVRVLGGAPEDGDLAEIIGDKRIKDMNDFSLEEIKLSKIIELPTEENGYANKRLYDLLLDATSFDPATGTYNDTKIYSDMIIGDLTGGNFNIENVRLNKVIQSDPASPNVILDELLSDDSVNIGNLATKINELSLEDVYGQEVFTTDASSPSVLDTNARYSYNEETKTYTLDKVNGTHYVSNEGKVWAFMFYNITSSDSEGYATAYVKKEITFSELQNGVGDVSDAVMNATIRQLYLSGILNAKYDNIMALTTAQVIESLNTALGSI